MHAWRFSFRIFFGLFCTLVLPAAMAAADCRDADLIVHNANVVTMDAAHPSASAMAIRDGRILAAGGEKEILACASERTHLIDLQGKTVLPGLIDIHTHAME